MADEFVPIEEDMRFQRRTWKIERTGWVLLALIVAAALLGVFSNGYLSNASVRQDGLGVQYERFQRRTVTTHLRVSVPVDDDGEAHLRVGKGLLDAYDIDGIDPRPTRAAADETGLLFDFGAGPTRALTAAFTLRPRRAGLVHLSLGLPKRDPLILRTLVYP